MKVDKYTKIILTVIAICLCWISIRDLSIIQPAEAVDSRLARDVKIINTAPIPVALYAQVNDYHSSVQKYKWIPVEAEGADFDSMRGFQSARITVSDKK